MASLGSDTSRSSLRLLTGGGAKPPLAGAALPIEARSAAGKLMLVRGEGPGVSEVKLSSRRRDEIRLSRSLGAYHALTAAACGVWLESGGVIIGAAIGDSSVAARAIGGIVGATAGSLLAVSLFKCLARGRVVQNDGVIRPEGISYGVGSAIGFLPAVAIPFLPFLCTTPLTIGLSMFGSVAMAMLAGMNCRSREELLAKNSN